MSITITSEEVKSYLVISSTTYDANITSILSFWNTALDEIIDTDYTTDYENIIRAGKLLVICSKIRDSLPTTSTARSSERIEYTMGKATTVIDNRISSSKLNDAGMTLLQPYLKSGANLDIVTSNDELEYEFTNNDMEHWK